MTKPAILVVDDDESIASTVAVFLSSHGYEVTVAMEGAEALERIREGDFPVIISDIYLDQVSGLDILREARRRNPDVAVILMTARGSVGTTVEAEVEGAFEYLAKPFELRALLDIVERAQAVPPSAHSSGDVEPFGNLTGFSPGMVEVYKRIARAARSEETVLITGETGVGKELVARAIHEHSPRAAKPFAPLDCGAVTGTLWESELFGAVRGAFTGAERDRSGVIESARGGSVFLDEIGEVPLEFQAKLLRFLQEKEYRPVGAGTPRRADVRILAATNRDLEKMTRDGRFREDLFYRLSVLRIDVPPLRERREDIPLLIRRFLADRSEAAARRVWLEPGAERYLQAYDWPGNVRQLENAIRRAIALSPPGPVSEQAIAELVASGEESEPDSGALGEVERRQILRVLEQTGGNKTRAAEILGVQRRTLYKKLQRIERERSGTPKPRA
jgi:DNA-binding NtrC family response regulator